MKVVIAIALCLFCVAGFIAVTKRKSATTEASKAPQTVEVVNNVSAVKIENLSVTDGLATFNVVNVSDEPLTAVVIHSGRFRVVSDGSYWDKPINGGEKYTISLNIDGANPLTVDALIYQSGRSEGDRVAIEKIENTRSGYKIGIGMIQNAIGNEQSTANLKAAISNLQISKEQFESPQAYDGAKNAREDVLEQLSRIESESQSNQTMAADRVRNLKNRMRMQTR
jgi:hypothetical protein